MCRPVSRCREPSSGRGVGCWGFLSASAAQRGERSPSVQCASAEGRHPWGGILCTAGPRAAAQGTGRLGQPVGAQARHSTERVCISLGQGLMRQLFPTRAPEVSTQTCPLLAVDVTPGTGKQPLPVPRGSLRVPTGLLPLSSAPEQIPVSQRGALPRLWPSFSTSMSVSPKMGRLHAVTSVSLKMPGASHGPSAPLRCLPPRFLTAPCPTGPPYFCPSGCGGRVASELTGDSCPEPSSSDLIMNKSQGALATPSTRRI